MEGKVIKGNEIIEQGALDPAIKNAQDLLVVLDKLDVTVKNVAKDIKTVNKGLNSKTAGDLQKVAAAEKQATQAAIDNEKIQRQKIQTEKALMSLNRQKETQARKESRQREQLTNAYKRESKQLNDLRNAYKNLAAQGRGNTKVAKGWLKEITRLDTKLKGLDKTVGQSQRNVGNYQSGFSKLGGTIKGIGARFLGFTAIIYGAGRALVSSFKTFRDFQQGSANLAAVLGKSRKEIKALTKDAKRLGSTTAFTASQVTELQTEFSKLGFNEDQILAATEATLDLAAATGTELADAAAIAGATLGGFGLEAEETQRVVDVMAKSFSASALDMEKFKESMKTAAPAAAAVNIPIERTTALLGTLANAGISGSIAGNSLKTSLIKLNDAGLTLEKGLEKVAKSQDKLGTASKLVGKNAAAAFLVLAKGREETDKLEKSLQNAGGAAKEMADTQLDTLSGATTRLSSAWEGFILTLEDGDGVIGKVLRNAIDQTTELLNQITALSMSDVQFRNSKLTEYEGLGSGISQERNQAILNFQQMSNDELEKSIKNQVQFADSAEIILKARKEGLNLFEQEVLLNATAAVDAKKKINEFKALEEERAKYTDEEFNSLLAKLGVELDLLDINEKSAKAVFDGVNAESKALAIARLKKSSQEELVALLGKQEVLNKTLYGRATLYLAEQELKRRKDIKGEVLETAEIEGSSNSNKEKQLTGLAKLQKELNELEKERSDYLVTNKGALDSEFLNKTEEVKLLEERIAILKRTLKERGIEKVEARSAGNIETTSTDSEIARDPSAKSAEKILAEEQKKNDTLSKISQDALTISTAIIDQRIAALDRLAQAEQEKFNASMSREQQIANQRDVTAAAQAESLAFEREEQAKALAAQEKIAKKKQRLALITTGLDLLNSKIQAGDSNSVGSTLSDVSALIAGLNALPTFWTGTDTTVGDALGMKVSEGRDGVLARVDKSEMIFNKKKSDTLKSYGLGTTDKVVKSAISYQMGLLDNKSTNVSVPKINFDNGAMTSKLESIETELKTLNRKPNSQISLEQLGSLLKVKETIVGNNTTTTKSMNVRLGK